MAVELSAEQIRRVLQGISVPPQPQIMVDLQMEQVMPVPDLKAIARLISQDPGLSGRCSSWSTRRISVWPTASLPSSKR